MVKDHTTEEVKQTVDSKDNAQIEVPPSNLIVPGEIHTFSKRDQNLDLELVTGVFSFHDDFHLKNTHFQVSIFLLQRVRHNKS